MSIVETVSTVEQTAKEYVRDESVAFGFTFARDEGKHVATFASMYADSHNDAVAMASARTRWINGYMAHKVLGSRKLTISDVVAAATVLGLKGFKADAIGDDTNGRRTEEQERMYAAARKAWERLLRASGFATTEKRGGAREAMTETPAPTSAVEAPAPAAAPTSAALTPEEGAKYTTVAHGHSFMMQAAANILATMDKHPTAFDSNLRKMAKDFAKHVGAYVVAE